MTQFEIGSAMGEAIIVASQSAKVKDCADLEIKKVIGYIFALIGIKPENLPTDFQSAVIINFMRSNLGNYTLEEFKNAFHALAEKKLDMNGNHYQNFSAIYLGDVMSAYQKLKNNAYKDYRIAEIKMENAEKQQVNPQHRKEQTHDFIRECIIKPWRFYLKTGTITFGIVPYNVIYGHLSDKMGLLDVPLSIKKEIHAEALKIAKLEVSKKTDDKTEFDRLKHLKNEIERIGFEKAMDYIIKKECYRMSINRFFEQSKTDGVDLEEQIETWIKNDNGQ